MIGLPSAIAQENSLERNAASAIVGKGNEVMEKLNAHFREKLVTPDEARRISEERYDIASADAGILEGDKKGGKNCCIRKDELGGSSIGVGARCTTYVCSETYAGECRWRSCAEPSLTCLWMIEQRLKVREEDAVSKRTVPLSVLVHGCTNKDAMAEADNERIENFTAKER